MQPTERILTKVGESRDACRDQRMSDLEQERAAPRQDDDVLPTEFSQRAVVFEEAISPERDTVRECAVEQLGVGGVGAVVLVVIHAPPALVVA